MGMNVKDKPNKISATLKVIATGEFYDDDATEETLRFAVEQNLEDAGFDIDVALLEEQEAVEPDVDSEGTCSCGNCGTTIGYYPVGCNVPEICKFCPECGREVKLER